MSFTADDYRTAAKLLRTEHFDFIDPQIVADSWEGAADKCAARDEYARGLGEFINHRVNPADMYVQSGAIVMGKLLEDGWTPPEGLFP